jgi:site-specific recombinase XerD
VPYCTTRYGLPKIPYTVSLSYVHPPVDNARSEYYVDVPPLANAATTNIETVEEGIEMYMEAFCQKFRSKMGRTQRRICLQYFQRYLASEGHSMKLKDLTFNDDQGFIDSLVNYYNGLPLRPSEIKKYRSAIRSFSRFLHQIGAIEENIFLTVRKL